MFDMSNVSNMSNLYIIDGGSVVPSQILILYLDKYDPDHQQIQMRFLTNTANIKLQDAIRSPASTPIPAGKWTNAFYIFNKSN